MISASLLTHEPPPSTTAGGGVADPRQSARPPLAIPSQHGRVAVVTGTGGLGYEVARALAQAGAAVVLAGRSEVAAHRAISQINREHPGTQVVFESLDLASLASIAAFAARLRARLPRLDLLVNTAGETRIPARRLTQDGFEVHLGTTQRGPFAMTAYLLPLLRLGADPRVVGVGSLSHQFARLDFNDLQSANRYDPSLAHARSMLAAMLFAFELDRRSRAGGWGITSLAAHPGATTTRAWRSWQTATTWRRVIGIGLGYLILPVPETAVAPLLYAATATTVEGGDYFGPTGFFELRGPPGPAEVWPEARDRLAARRLWDTAERLTGVTYPALG